MGLLRHNLQLSELKRSVFDRGRRMEDDTSGHELTKCSDFVSSSHLYH